VLWKTQCKAELGAVEEEKQSKETLYRPGVSPCMVELSTALRRAARRKAACLPVS
jgi:hypothetical protein